MTAASSQSPIGGEARAHEPSMEEILASIRRIIADDQSLPGRGAPLDVGLRGTDEPQVTAPPESFSRSTLPGSSSTETSASEPSRSEPQPSRALPSEIFANEKLPPEPAAVPNHFLRLDREKAEPAPEVEENEPASTASDAPFVPEPAEVPRMTIAAPQFASPDAPFQPHSRSDIVEMPRVVPAENVEPIRPAFVSENRMPEMQESNVKLAEPDPSDYEAPLRGAVAQQRPDAPSDLFSTGTDQSITSAFNMLAATRLADNSEELMAMVREMIRPLLKDWLDDNLPTMVERMVRSEIERVARGGR